MQTMQILQEIKLKYGLNTTQVAKKLGMKQSTVHRIATGETKDCRLSNHSKICLYMRACNHQTKQKPLAVTRGGLTQHSGASSYDHNTQKPPQCQAHS